MDCYTILTGLLHIVISPFGYYLAFVLNSSCRLTMLPTVSFSFGNSVMCSCLWPWLLFCFYSELVGYSFKKRKLFRFVKRKLFFSCMFMLFVLNSLFFISYSFFCFVIAVIVPYLFSVIFFPFLYYLLYCNNLFIINVDFYKMSIPFRGFSIVECFVILN